MSENLHQPASDAKSFLAHVSLQLAAQRGTQQRDQTSSLNIPYVDYEDKKTHLDNMPHLNNMRFNGHHFISHFGRVDTHFRSLGIQSR